MSVKRPEIVLKVVDKPVDSGKSIFKYGFLIEESCIHHAPLVAFRVETCAVKSLDINVL